MRVFKDGLCLIICLSSKWKAIVIQLLTPFYNITHPINVFIEVPTISTICIDITNTAAVSAVIEEFGDIHLLVNNAGVSVLEPFLEVKEEHFDKMFAVNVKAVLFISQAIAKKMIAGGHGGSIVNISSKASQVALKNHTLYCSTKGALDMLTKMMALELGPYKIRVNSVNPTVVMTDMGKMAWSDPAVADPVLKRIPLGKFAEEKDVVHTILYLLSDKAEMVHGVTLPVDGGFLVN